MIKKTVLLRMHVIHVLAFHLENYLWKRILKYFYYKIFSQLIFIIYIYIYLTRVKKAKGQNRARVRERMLVNFIKTRYKKNLM